MFGGIEKLTTAFGLFLRNNLVLQRLNLGCRLIHRGFPVFGCTFKRRQHTTRIFFHIRNRGSSYLMPFLLDHFRRKTIGRIDINFTRPEMLTQDFCTITVKLGIQPLLIQPDGAGIFGVIILELCRQRLANPWLFQTLA